MKAVLLDAFGTLVEITNKRHPYAMVGASRSIMTKDVPLVDPDAIAALNDELDSIVVYNDVIPFLEEMRAQGVRTAIVSNLARPYGEALTGLLGDYVDVLHYSYMEGRLKPDPTFFRTACEKLGVPPSSSTMIGDNYQNDYCGALEAGLSAAMIVRPEASLWDLYG